MVERRHVEHRLHDVAQPLLHPDAARQATVERRLAKHVVHEHHRGVIGVGVLHLERLARDEDRVRLVRRLHHLLPTRGRRQGRRDGLERLGALPRAEELRGELCHRAFVEIPDDDELSVRGAVEIRVELSHVPNGGRLQHLDLLVGRRDVPGVALGISRDLPRERHLANHVRVPALRLDGGERLALQLLELRAVQRRLAQHVADEPQRGGEARARGLDRDADVEWPRRRHVDARLQRIERIGELLARERLRAPHEHRRGERRRHRPIRERLLRSNAQADEGIHRLAAILLRQEGDAKSGLER